jgi:hypothetical protein
MHRLRTAALIVALSTSAAAADVITVTVTGHVAPWIWNGSTTSMRR